MVLIIPRRGTVSVNTGRNWTVHMDLGMSPRGKAQDFDSCIRWFKSGHPCQGASVPILSSSGLAANIARLSLGEGR